MSPQVLNAVTEDKATELINSVLKGASTLLQAAEKSGGVGADMFDDLLAQLELDADDQASETQYATKEAIMLLAHRSYDLSPDEIE